MTNNKHKENKLPFIVETGNWKVRVMYHPVDDELNNHSYMEACTRAFEYVFGNIDNDDVKFLSLKDKNAKEYIEVLYKKNVGEEAIDLPDPVFGVITICRLEDDENDKNKWWVITTSRVFINATMYNFVPISQEAEKQFQKHLDDIEAKKKLKPKTKSTLKKIKRSIKKITKRKKKS